MSDKKSLSSKKPEKENIKISEQLPLMAEQSEVVKQLLELALDSMTPIEAIKHLHELQEHAKKL